MCIGIDSNLVEVTRIVPTLKGASIFMLFYGFDEEALGALGNTPNSFSKLSSLRTRGTLTNSNLKKEKSDTLQIPLLRIRPTS